MWRRIVIQGWTVVLHAEPKYTMADGDGIKLLWEWKGGGGIRCCLVCANIVSKPHLAAAHPDLFDCSCATVDKFQLRDFETLHQVIRTLLANEATWLRGHMT